jgi:hypothetical protein
MPRILVVAQLAEVIYVFFVLCVQGMGSDPIPRVAWWTGRVFVNDLDGQDSGC